MKKKLIIQIAEGLGNQLFMYAFAYSLSKKLNYGLYIDNKSGYSRNKNLLRNHQFYMLNNFNITNNIAPDNLIYDTPFKLFQKKFKLFFDIFLKKKKFLIEKQIRIENKKIVQEFINLDSSKVSDNLYLQGNFENHKYFLEYKDDLYKVFTPKNELIDRSNPLIDRIKNSNSISLHIRRNRFSDQHKLKTSENIQKSDIFVENIQKDQQEMGLILQTMDLNSLMLWSTIIQTLQLLNLSYQILQQIPE